MISIKYVHITYIIVYLNITIKYEWKKMKCNKLFLASILLLAVISLGAVCAADNQTSDDSIALDCAQDDMDGDIEPAGENQKDNIEIGSEALFRSSDEDNVLNIQNNLQKDILTLGDSNQEPLKNLMRNCQR